MNATCVECQKSFHTRAPKQAKFCSQSCKWLARKRRDGIPCEVCGEPTGWTRRSGKTSVTHNACGRLPCGTVASYKRGCRCAPCRAATNEACKAWQTADRARRGKMVRACVECGAEFNPRANQVLCSPACRKAVLGRYGDHRSRATHWGVDYEPIDRLAIFERDGWVCGICELPIDPAATFPDPGSATLDHILPMSLGGGHVPSNVTCAHFYCNTVKGNRLEEAC